MYTSIAKVVIVYSLTHSLTYSLDNQRKIEEAIKNENINNNRNLAMENIPESFVAVCMLYVRISINDTPIMAFVDSGAQSTIMSIKCAEKCTHTLASLLTHWLTRLLTYSLTR